MVEISEKDKKMVVEAIEQIKKLDENAEVQSAFVWGLLGAVRGPDMYGLQKAKQLISIQIRDLLYDGFEKFQKRIKRIRYITPLRGALIELRDYIKELNDENFEFVKVLETIYHYYSHGATAYAFISLLLDDEEKKGLFEHISNILESIACSVLLTGMGEKEELLQEINNVLKSI